MTGALGLAASIASGATTAEAATAEALERIAGVNPALNCFTRVMGDEALSGAKRTDPSSPLAGVPFAVKNLYDVAGVTTLAGSKIFRDNPPAERDAALVAALKAAGAVLTGTLNMDEFAFGFTTENAHYGNTRNPRDPERTAGGSSGGSAAAVAAGLVPLALGSDTNGSVRVPAALCGVYGFKPTYGRVSRAGIAPLAWSFDHPGWFATSVADIAAVLDVAQGPDESDPVLTGRPPVAASRGLEDGIAGLNIAIAGGWFGTGGLAGAFAATADAARALGVTRKVDIPEAGRAVAAALLVTSAEGASLHLERIRTRISDFDPHTRDRWIAAALIPSLWVHNAQRFRRRFRDAVARLFSEIDILITPTTPMPAPLLGQGTIEIDGRHVPARPTLGRFTAPFSFIGLPALSAPLRDGGDLPLGVQIVAAPHRDDLVLRAARYLESKGVVGYG